LFVPDGVFLSLSSEKNRFPLFLHGVLCQAKSVIAQASSGFFERMYQVANTGTTTGNTWTEDGKRVEKKPESRHKGIDGLLLPPRVATAC
jgi:hypothetical protein